jgi:hypothetical protein
MRHVYLVLAIAGGIVPYVFFLRHFSRQGFGLPGFVAALFVNPAAGGFTVDLLVTSAVFWIFMFRKPGRAKGPHPALFIVLNLLIGLSCAFPAYLYARERRSAA